MYKLYILYIFIHTYINVYTYYMYINIYFIYIYIYIYIFIYIFVALTRPLKHRNDCIVYLIVKSVILISIQYQYQLV